MLGYGCVQKRHFSTLPSVPRVADVLMIAFVSVTIGRCCRGHVKQRSWLAIGGIMFVIAAGVAAYGVNSGFGELARTIKSLLTLSRLWRTRLGEVVSQSNPVELRRRCTWVRNNKSHSLA